MDDDTLTTDTLSPETNSSDSQVSVTAALSSHISQNTSLQPPRLSLYMCVQVQVLLQEVQQLREELRSRDRTIAQLTLQLVRV